MGLLVIVCAYAVLCLLYNLATPIGEGPDELDHIRYVEYLVRFGSFPLIGSGDSSQPYTFEAKQPPAYYLVNAGLILALGRAGKPLAPELAPDPGFGHNSADAAYTHYLHLPVSSDLLPWTYIMRATGMLMGVGTIILTFGTIRQTFPSDTMSPLAVGGSAVVGLLPQFTFISSVVTNDNLAILLGAGISYLSVRMLRVGVTWRGSTLMGSLLGLSTLTKTNLLVFVPFGLLILMLPGIPVFLLRGRSTAIAPLPTWGTFLRRRLPMVVLAAFMCVIVSGWWLGRNALLYNGLFAREAVTHMAGQALPGPIVDPSKMEANQIEYTVNTSLAFFGWEAIGAPLLLYIFFYALLLLALAGLLIDLWRRELNVYQAMCLMLGLLVTGLLYAGMMYQASWRGRLIFPALAFIGLLLARGTYSWLGIALHNRPERAASITAGLWIVFLGVANIYCLLDVLIPAYYGS